MPPDTLCRGAKGKVTKSYKTVTKWLHFGNKKKTKNYRHFRLTFFLNCGILEFRAYCLRPGASGPTRYRVGFHSPGRFNTLN